MQNFKLLISGSYNVFNESWNSAGVYMASGLYQSQTFLQPIYLGSAVDLQDRIENGHIHKLDRNKHPHNPPLQHAWNNHGKENFVWWLLETCPPEQVLIREQVYLDLYRPFCDEFRGFNLAKFANSPNKGNRFYVRLKEPVLIKNMVTDEEILVTCLQETAEKLKIKAPSLRSLVVGDKNYVFDWYRPDRWIPKKYEVYSPEKIRYIVVETKINEFCREHNLGRTTFNRMLDGKFAHCKGWSLTIEIEQRHNGYKGKNFIIVNPEGKIIESKNLYQFAKQNKLSSNCLRLVLLGYRNNHKGWRKYDKEIVLQPFKNEEYNFVNPEGKIVVTNCIAELARENNLDSGGFYDVIKGRQRSHFGWRYYKEGMELKPFVKNVYKLVDPNGQLITITSIDKFSKENHFSFNKIRKLLDKDIKEHKGWTLYQEN